MTEKPLTPQQQAKKREQEKLAQALRDNLKRRKSQAQARAAGDQESDGQGRGPEAKLD